MIQVELAGPRLPTTFEFIPNDIIEMAQRIQGECVQGSTYFGGFMTSDMAVLKSWIVSAESELSKPFRRFSNHPRLIRKRQRDLFQS